MDKENFINRWKATADELRVQLHLGSRELSDSFEEQKKEILRWSEEARTTLETEASSASAEMRTKLEELEVQAALGKAESKDAIQEQRKKLTSLITEANESSIELLGDSKKNVRDLAVKADTKFDEWHTRFDLLRLQISLGAADASVDWNDKKKDLKQSIQKLESKLEAVSDDSEEGWISFKGEISEAWTHVKKAFSKTE
jgi:lipid II:glycine glycyltransferase (peptidoglycan interpeptide bridge formation enzyme)